MPIEAGLKKLKLPLHFTKYFNIHREFSKWRTELSDNRSLDDMLVCLNLKLKEQRRKALNDCQSLVRLINRMVKGGHRFEESCDTTKPPSPPDYALKFAQSGGIQVGKWDNIDKGKGVVEDWNNTEGN